MGVNSYTNRYLCNNILSCTLDEVLCILYLCQQSFSTLPVYDKKTRGTNKVTTKCRYCYVQVALSCYVASQHIQEIWETS